MVFIYRVPVPVTVEGDGMWELREVARLDREASQELTGTDDQAGAVRNHAAILQPGGSWEVTYYLALAERSSYAGADRDDGAHLDATVDRDTGADREAEADRDAGTDRDAKADREAETDRDAEAPRRTALGPVVGSAPNDTLTRGASSAPQTALGWASLSLPLRDNVGTGSIHVTTDRRYRRQGIARALHDAALFDLHAAGRAIATGYAYCPEEPPAGTYALNSPTGVGRVPLDAPSTQFCLAMGYSLGLVERTSLLELPVEPARLASLGEAARAVSGPDYRVVVWINHCPHELLDGVAHLNATLSTDAPSGQTGWEPQLWDADRVRAAEESTLAAGNTVVAAAAVHVPTGAVVGHTEMNVSGAHPEVAYQQNTVVARDHRGHRLGLLLKVANLSQLPDAAPGVRRIHTWNAEENSHMLAINTALGFRPAGVEGQWTARDIQRS